MHQRQKNHGRPIRMVFKWLLNIQRDSKPDIEWRKYTYKTEIVVIIQEEESQLSCETSTLLIRQFSHWKKEWK